MRGTGDDPGGSAHPEGDELAGVGRDQPEDGEANRPDADELDRTAGRSWFAAGVFVGLGAAPAVGLAIYAISRPFFEHGVAILIVLAAAVLSFALGLAYVALARALEP